MTETTNPLNALLAKSAESLKSDWRDLVAVAVALTRDRGDVDQVAHQLARASGTAEDSIKRKIVAIQYSQSLGFDEADIVKKGQTATLSEYAHSRKQENYEKLTNLTFKIPGSQREMVKQELDRVCRVCDFKTSEKMWDWLLSELRQLSDESLKHSAGMNK
jgi:hypothetical protein